MKRFIKAVGGMKHSVIYTDTDGKHFRFSGGTWTWRNHNPGNVYAASISKRHNQIGITHDFAVFPDNKFGHASLLDSLIATFGNMSIHEMIYIFAPPNCNPTKKYEKYLHKKIGVYDNTKIKNFTKTQFKKLWETIQHFEGFKIGKIVEVYRISGVQILGKHQYQYCLDEGEWISESQCIRLAKQKKVELEVCISHLGNTFLRSPPDSSFQPKLEDLICKK